MLTDEGVYLGTSTRPEYLELKFANRHGLITGATGTGKTVTLQILAEGFSRAGVPVFCADVKGDVVGLSQAGEPEDVLAERADSIGFEDYEYGAFPTILWDLFGGQGHQIRTTVTEMGPLLLARMLGLNETQEGVLNATFKLADDEQLLLLDFKDLRSLLAYVGEQRAELSARYGNISTASVGAIQRALLVLEQQGGDGFFGEPALDITDLMRTDAQGRGFMSILAADRLMRSPRLYAILLLWLLSELFEELPEVGDPDKPKLVFFFDEAHLIFSEAPPALRDTIEQVVKLVRSKGVGVYFVTQNPADVPEPVLAQLGNRIQHALRAYTPNERKAVRAAADSFRPNPEFDTEETITQLGTGEALVSVLRAKGVLGVVGQTMMRPPSSRMGPTSDAERQALLNQSPIVGLYGEVDDRESAYELLEKRARTASRDAEIQALEKEYARRKKEQSRPSRRALTRQTPMEAALTTFARTVARRPGIPLCAVFSEL